MNSALATRIRKGRSRAVNPRRAPQWILAAHGSYQIPSFPRNLRASGSSVAYLPAPIPPESLTMPSDDGFRLYDNQGRTPA
jgi:hypothetical protein